jgi:hypothetical protein
MQELEAQGAVAPHDSRVWLLLRRHFHRGTPASSSRKRLGPGA